MPPDDPNNTVNAYRRTFEVPKHWSGRRVLLTFDGVNSFFQLWVNGERVGVGKDSRTPVEFDITSFSSPARICWRWKTSAGLMASFWSARISGV